MTIRSRSAFFISTKVFCAVILFVVSVQQAGAQQQRSCPQMKPDIRAKAISYMIRRAEQGHFKGCRPGPAAPPDIDCELSMTFLAEAGVSPVYLGTPWSVLVACFPEMKSVKSLNERAIARKAELESGKRIAAKRAKQEQQEKDNEPVHILTRTYYDYILVRKCFDARNGYVSVNISTAEMERAKKAAKGIEDSILKRNPSVDKNAVWKIANSDSENWKTDTDKIELMLLQQYDSRLQVDLSDRTRCQNTLGALEKRFERLVPEENAVKKDF